MYEVSVPLHDEMLLKIFTFNNQNRNKVQKSKNRDHNYTHNQCFVKF